MKFWGFPYNNLHYLTHPWLFFDDLFRNIKFGVQRFVRGWDDSAAWSIDGWMCDLLPDILSRLKRDHHGIPFPLYEVFSGNEEMSEQEWTNILDKIIAGFSSAKKILEFEWENDEELNALQKTWSDGMDLFKEHFFELWD